MGLFVNLYVNSHDITPESWEETYQESLSLLERFPLPLMRLQREEIRGQKRYVYTTRLIEEKDTQDEHWEIDGDLLSYQRAESFRLYRYQTQRSSHRLVNDDKHVLWADEDALEYVDGNGIDLFGNKTQGYPYHLAILAVGILFESRFPNNSFVTGDIDRTQAESVISWMNTILATPAIMPICLDGNRLYSQLDAIYDDTSLAIRRFKTLFRDTDEEQLKTLLRYGDRTHVLQNIVETLQNYSQLSQLGVINQLSQFLSVTQDVRQLIEIVMQVGKEKSEFNLEELLRVLGNKFITIEPSEREPLYLFIRSSDTLMNIQDTFAQVFLKIGGAPSFIDIYIARSELVEIFSAYQPAKQQKFNQILDECEKHCRDELEKTKTLLNEMEKREKSEAPAEIRDEVESSQRVPPQSASGLPEEEYIIKQAHLQQKTYEHPEEGAKQIGAQLQLIIQEHPDIFGSDDRQYYLDAIYKASSDNGFALRESAWHQIDQAQNIKLLKSLLAFSLVSERETSFWNWRIHIMENSYLWSYLINEANSHFPDAIPS